MWFVERGQINTWGLAQRVLPSFLRETGTGRGLLSSLKKIMCLTLNSTNKDIFGFSGGQPVQTKYIICVVNYLELVCVLGTFFFYCFKRFTS